MPITLQYSQVVAGRCWGRLATRMGMQSSTQVPAWNRMQVDLHLQDKRDTALFCPNIYHHFP